MTLFICLRRTGIHRYDNVRVLADNGAHLFIHYLSEGRLKIMTFARKAIVAMRTEA